MKAGSLSLRSEIERQLDSGTSWMTARLLCERSKRRHRQEKCASKCVRGIVLSAFIYFLTQMDLRFEIILNLEFEI
jgi:hypothetical protein